MTFRPKLDCCLSLFPKRQLCLNKTTTDLSETVSKDIKSITRLKVRHLATKDVIMRAGPEREIL